MFRFFVRCLLICAIIAFTFLGIKAWMISTKKAPPLFLQHTTFLEGTGISSLGKRFVLRYKSDRVLFSSSKNRLQKQRRAWSQNKKESIPKSIHFIWLSPERMPEYIQQNQAFIKQFNPHCAFNIWDSTSLKQRMTEKEKKLFDTLPSELQNTYATAFLLYHDGGAIIDPHVQCLCSFEELLTSGDWITSFEPPLQQSEEKRHLWLSSTFFAATKNHPLTKAWLSAITSYFNATPTTQLPIKKQYLEGCMLPLMNILSSDQQGNYSAYILPATCFTPIAPQFIHSYLKKLAGEDTEEKKDKNTFSYHEKAPFSKIARCSFGLHLKGGSLAYISSKDRKDKDPF